MSEQDHPEQTEDRRFPGSCTHGGDRGGSGAVPEPAEASDEKPARRQGLHPEGAPAAASGYSPGIRAEGRRVVFVSGQGPKDLKADMETQIRQTFDRIGYVLKAGGASFRDVVMIRGLLRPPGLVT